MNPSYTTGGGGEGLDRVEQHRTCADDDATGGAEEASRRSSGAGVGAATLVKVKGQGTTAASVVNERVQMEERDNTCEDDDGGRCSFATGLRRRGGCANPSQMDCHGKETRRRRRRHGWDGGVRGGGRPYLRRRRCEEERDRRRRGGCARTLAK